MCKIEYYLLENVMLEGGIICYNLNSKLKFLMLKWTHIIGKNRKIFIDKSYFNTQTCVYKIAVLRCI